MQKTLRKLSSCWNKIPETPKDKILYFNHLFQQETNSKKVNLTIGAYRDENGKPWNLPSVMKALDQLQREGVQMGYLPPKGDEEFQKLAIEVAYSRDSNGLLAGTYKDTQVATAQCLSGAGGLLLFFHVLKEFYEPLQKVNKQVWMSQPTWPNHEQMSIVQGLNPKYYKYYDLENRKFDYESFVKSLKEIPEYSPVIFHPVGHNPTGFDPSQQQWQEIIDIAEQRKFMNVFDMAYQGFVSGNLNSDAYSVQLFAKAKLPMMVIQSFAKNFGLYGQRVGCFSIPNEDEDWVEKMNGFLGSRIRRLYSSNPRIGSDIVKTVLKNKDLRKQWDEDIATMSSRMIEMRKLLYSELQKTDTQDDWSYITEQQGMFAFTHITAEQAKALREKHAVYMLESGRISVCGLTKDNASYVANAIADVTKNNQII